MRREQIDMINALTTTEVEEMHDLWMRLVKAREELKEAEYAAHQLEEKWRKISIKPTYGDSGVCNE